MLCFGSVLLIIAAVQCGEFVLAYHLQTRGTWRRSQMGWHTMMLAAALGAVFALGVVRIAAQGDLASGGPPWFQVARVVVYASVVALLAWRRVLLAQAQSRPS